MRLDRLEVHAVDHCTLACKFCSHAAEMAPKKTYQPGEYEPHLKTLARKMSIGAIDILGGEPFIHRDLMSFITMLRRYTPVVGTMTNLFWMHDEQSIDRHIEIIQNLNRMVITLYQPYVDRLGLGRTLELVDYMRSKAPGCSIHQWEGMEGKVVTTFGEVNLHDEWLPIINPHCSFRGCKQLLADGRMLGCCVALRNPNLPSVASDTITVDRPVEEIHSWLHRDILDLCHHCSIATTGQQCVTWEQTR